MSYRIVFKGNMGDEFVEESIGRILAEDFKNNVFDERIVINGNVYDSKSIKAVVSGYNDPDKSDKNEENLKMIRDMWADHNAAKEKLMKLSIPDRAKSGANLGLAGVVFMAVKGRLMTEEDKSFVIERSKEWLTTHPDFDIASPSCYILKGELGITSTIALSSKDALRIESLQFAERILIA